MKGAWFTLIVILRYLVTGNCGSIGCCYVEPYGFVPEAGCPVHDADTRFSRWARKVRKGGEQSPWQTRGLKSPDIATAIREVIDREGWSPGHIFVDSGDANDHMANPDNDEKEDVK